MSMTEKRRSLEGEIVTQKYREEDGEFDLKDLILHDEQNRLIRT